MKFEKEILADYKKLVEYLRYAKRRYRPVLKLNACTADDSDFINDAILDFNQQNPENYDIKILFRSLNRSMGLEEKIIKKHTSYDLISDESSKKADKAPEKPHFAASQLGILKQIFNTKPVWVSDECKYYVLKDGRCISHMITNNRVRFLKPLIRNDGYVQYVFLKKAIYAHRAVYETYGGTIPEDMEVHHIDHDKKNNHIDNLMLVTHRENWKFYAATFSKNPNFVNEN